MAEKEGEEYRDSKYKMGQFKELISKIEEREKHKDLYEAVAKVKKLSIGEIQKLLVSVFEGENYTNLQFQPPEMNKDVKVSFTAIDNKTGRQEYDSKKILKKLIEQALDNTNWKLMSEGVSYRVGYVSGRLRCIEREEDLVDQIRAKE